MYSYVFLLFKIKKIIDYDDFYILFHSINCLNLQIYYYHCFLIIKIFMMKLNNIIIQMT